MTGNIDEGFLEALNDFNTTEAYGCRNCGLVRKKARTVRKHMLSQHDNPLGIERITE